MKNVLRIDHVLAKSKYGLTCDDVPLTSIFYFARLHPPHAVPQETSRPWSKRPILHHLANESRGHAAPQASVR